MNLKIREYLPSDRESLKKLIIYLQDFHNNLEPEIISKGEDVADEFLSNLLTQIKDSNGKIYVSETDGTISGFISGHIEKTPNEIELLERKFFYISNLSVFPEFQNLGIGRELLKKITDYAKGLRIKLVEVSVMVKNQKAFEIYKKEGFEEFEKVMIRKF